MPESLKTKLGAERKVNIILLYLQKRKQIQEMKVLKNLSYMKRNCHMYTHNFMYLCIQNINVPEDTPASSPG